jgi:hypothetical protein
VQAFACEECRRSKKTCKRTASKSCQRCKSKGTSCIASVTDGRYKKGRLTQTPDEPEVVQAVDNVPRALDAAQGAQTIDMPQPANLNMPIVDEARAAFSIAYCMAVWAGAPCTNVAPEAARLQDLVARVLGRPLPVRSLLLLAGQIPRWMDLAAPDRRRMDATADQMWSRVAIVEPAWIQGQPSGQSVHAALWNMISSAGVRGSWVWHCVLGGHWERALRTVSGSW